MKGRTNCSNKGSIFKDEMIFFTIKTNQLEHDILLGKKIIITYGDETLTYLWGGSEINVNIPANSEYTIEFEEIENYKSPDTYISKAVGGASKALIFTYLTEKVTVNVTADDGDPTDGQKVIVKNIKNGVYIQDIDGNLWTVSDWDGTRTLNGIAVVSNKCSFVIAPEAIGNPNVYYWSQSADLTESGLVPVSIAESDFNGRENTEILLSEAALGSYFSNHIFPNNQEGYLGSAGEWAVVMENKLAINQALVKCGKNELIESNYWTSTIYEYSNIYFADITNNAFIKKSGSGTAMGLYGGYIHCFLELSVPSSSYIVTDSKATFNIPHGKEYVVSLSNKEGGYSTPSPQAYIADSPSRVINMEYECDKSPDLSLQDVHGNPILQSTANCYVVKTPGIYKFPIAYGAAFKNGQINTEAYTNNGGNYSNNFVNYNNKSITSPFIEIDTGKEVGSVQISISDIENLVTNLDIIKGDCCRYVRFTVPNIPKTGGNAIISVKDSSGTIMWSWHIWTWEDDLTPVTITNNSLVDYNIMPVNLGSKYDSDSKTYQQIKNWFYQYGRPTPLLCTASYNSANNHTSYGNLTFGASSTTSNMSYGIKNPATFFKGSSSYRYNWFSTSPTKTVNLWDAACTNLSDTSNRVTVKTVYDPCPVGWKVPGPSTFTNFTVLGVVGSFNSGWKFKRYSGDTIGIFFPASGLRDYSSGNAGNLSACGYYWVSGGTSDSYVYRMNFTSTSRYNNTQEYRSQALSIRPITDDTVLSNQVKLTTIRIDQTISDPESMITRIVDEGGIEEIRANSHRYVGTYDTSSQVMQLKQLMDSNGTKFADGTDASSYIKGNFPSSGPRAAAPGGSPQSNVFMKLPKFFYKMEEVSTDVWEFSVCYGESSPSSSYKEWDGKDLIGVYEALRVYGDYVGVFSFSGYTPNAVLKSDFESPIAVGMNSQITNSENYFSLIHWKHHCIMVMLFYTYYSHTNCQEICGSGNLGSYTTGSSDSLGMSDTTPSNGTSFINFWGLENWWGGVEEILWNVSYSKDSESLEIEDDDEIRSIGINTSISSKFISKLTFSDNLDIIPKYSSDALNASATTGYCDAQCIAWGPDEDVYNVATRAAGSSIERSGICCINSWNGLDTYTSAGSRLIYRGNYVIE